MNEWKLRRYKPMAINTKDDGASEHFNRFSITVSDEVYNDLIIIQEELKVSMPKLTANMIVMELNNVFKYRQECFSHKRNQMKKEELRDKISISNVFRMRIDTIADKIGIPRNALIAQALAEYLINNYTEYDNGVYVDSEGNNYHGVW